jgi:hypothetical protein
MCNRPEVRIFEIAASFALILVGIVVLWRARKGQPTFYLRYFWAQEQGVGCSTGVAVIFILLGILLFVSAVLYLDC